MTRNILSEERIVRDRRRPNIVALGTAAALLLSLVAAPTFAQAAPDASSVPTMLILDASGSMVRDAPGGGTRMAQAKQAAVGFVESVHEDQQLGLMVFGTGTGNEDSDQAAGCRDVKTLFELGTVDKAAYTSAINGIVESGFTPLGPAVEAAAAKLPKDKPATIVLVSDGVDTCSPPPSCERAESVKASYPQLTIHAIGFAVDSDEAAQEELTCIARVGGGEYVSAANSEQLTTKLRQAVDPTLLNGTVAPRGINEIELGMTIDEAVEAEPTLVTSDRSVQIVYAECDYAVIKFIDGVVSEIVPRESWPTAEGLAVGGDITKAEQLYGAPYREGSGVHGDFKTYPVSPNSPTAYRVYFDGTNITRIVVCTCGPGPAESTSTSESPTTRGEVLPISFDGYGEAKLGMTLEELDAAVPDANVGTYGEGQADQEPLLDYLQSPSNDLDERACVFSEYDRMTGTPYSVAIQGGVATSINGAASEFKTPGGLTGSVSYEDLAQEFGGLTVIPFGDDGNTRYERWVAADAAGRTINFYANPTNGSNGEPMAFAASVHSAEDAGQWLALDSWACGNSRER